MMRVRLLLFAYVFFLSQHLQISVDAISSNNSCSFLDLPNGRIKVRSRGRIAKFSCYKPYVLVGDNVATCVHGEWNTPLPFCAKPGCRKLDALANGELVAGYRGAVVKPICDAGFTLIGSPLLYCRANSWNDTLPSCQGHYLYLEANYPASLWSLRQVQLHGGVAQYISPLFPPLLNTDIHSCLIFWFYMYGPHTGTIRVNVGNDTVWEKIGNTDNKWQKALIVLQHQPSRFHVVIEGMGELGYYTNTAIDDLKITTGEECYNPSEEILEYTVEPVIVSRQDTEDIVTNSNLKNETSSLNYSYSKNNSTEELEVHPSVGITIPYSLITNRITNTVDNVRNGNHIISNIVTDSVSILTQMNSVSTFSFSNSFPNTASSSSIILLSPDVDKQIIENANVTETNDISSSTHNDKLNTNTQFSGAVTNEYRFLNNTSSEFDKTDTEYGIILQSEIISTDALSTHISQITDDSSNPVTKINPVLSNDNEWYNTTTIFDTNQLYNTSSTFLNSVSYGTDKSEFNTTAHVVNYNVNTSNTDKEIIEIENNYQFSTFASIEQSTVIPRFNNTSPIENSVEHSNFKTTPIISNNESNWSNKSVIINKYVVSKPISTLTRYVQINRTEPMSNDTILHNITNQTKHGTNLSTQKLPENRIDNKNRNHYDVFNDTNPVDILHNLKDDDVEISYINMEKKGEENDSIFNNFHIKEQNDAYFSTNDSSFNSNKYMQDMETDAEHLHAITISRESNSSSNDFYEFINKLTTCILLIIVSVILFICILTIVTKILNADDKSGIHYNNQLKDYLTKPEDYVELEFLTTSNIET